MIPVCSFAWPWLACALLAGTAACSGARKAGPVPDGPLSDPDGPASPSPDASATAHDGPRAVDAPAAVPDAPGSAAPDAASSPGPRVGAHALAFQYYGGNEPSIVAGPIDTLPGAVLLACVGRGTLSAQSAPTDNMGNGAFPQLGASHTYTRWTSSGTSLYGLVGARGGVGHVVTAANPGNDEITLAVVELRQGSRITSQTWTEVLAGQPIRSLPVTTSGPAVLVAFWWGDADVDGQKTATPDSGFQLIESIGLPGALVQAAVATRVVSSTGTYSVGWTSTPVQGAQLWLVAVE